MGTCPTRPGVGTTTVFSTHTIYNCDALPGICPSSGYVIGGGGTRTQSGETVITTTDRVGHTVTYTQIPTRPGTGTSGNGSNGGSTKTTMTTNTAQPTCPYSDNSLFTSSMGRVYDILCNEYFSDTTLSVQTQNSLGGCIAACDMYNTMSFMIASPCLGVSWYSMQTKDNCELKAGSSAVYQQGVDSARLKTPYTGPGGGNGTGSGNGTGPGNGGSSGTIGVTVTESMTSPPYLTTFVSGGSTGLTTIVKGGSTVLSTYVTGGSTEVTSIIRGGSTVVSSYVTGGSTAVTTVVQGGSTFVSTYVTGGSTIVQTVSGGGGGSGSGGGGGGGGSGTAPGGNGGGPGTGEGTGAGKSFILVDQRLF